MDQLLKNSLRLPTFISPVLQTVHKTIRNKLMDLQSLTTGTGTGHRLSQSHHNQTQGHKTFDNELYTELTPLQRIVLTAGTGLASFLDPTRAESIAVFGEVTAESALSSIYTAMLKDPEGSQILRDKPRINSNTLDLHRLSQLPPTTFGRTYYDYLQRHQVTPDSRLQVRFIRDPELAYLMQRYREIHDLVHTLTGQPTNMLGEVVVKWIEGIQTGLPMCVSGGLLGATRLRPKQRRQYATTHLPWAIRVGLTSKPFLSIYYEQHWDDDVTVFRESICPELNKRP